MVCKEEVYSWFRNLKGSKRIEAMCCFLNMCFPLELRFYGSCLEDLGRKDFYTFKEEEIKANEITEVLKIRGIHDSINRSKLIVVLSLLNSNNMNCAQELFKVINAEITVDTLSAIGAFSDLKLLDQYMLILTLAQHHPAFTFEQQTYLSELSIILENYVDELYSRIKYEENYFSHPYFAGKSLPSSKMPEREAISMLPYSYPYIPPNANSPNSQVQITSLKVKPPHKKMCLRIRVAWGSNKVTDAFKTPHDLFVFHQKLCQLYPMEAKNINQDKCIPPLSQIIVNWNKQQPMSENVICAATEYIQQLNCRLPGYVLESELVKSFFMPLHSNRSMLSRSHHRSADMGQVEMPPKNARLRSLTIYNSQMSENSPRHASTSRQKMGPSITQKKQCENGSNFGACTPPVNSPIPSPLSSPYASPLHSEANSRAASPWQVAPPSIIDHAAAVGLVPLDPLSMEKIQMKEVPEQWENSRNFKIEELQAMPIQELESLGLLKDSSTKIAKDLDCKSPPNGIIGCYVHKNALLLKSDPTHLTSNDSSPVCSEYSSPPQSPSLGDTCNQSSSLSSSNEESLEKRPLSKALTELCTLEESEPSAPDPIYKRIEDETVVLKTNPSRAPVSVIPFAAVPYSSMVPAMPPPNMKPAYLPIPCRSNGGPPHLNPGTAVFENQFSRIPLPSALTFMPAPPRSHSATPDRVLSPHSLPLSSVSPFPVVTSGCTTVPSATCSTATQKSNSVTAVTNSGASRYPAKHSAMIRDADLANKCAQPPPETPYATGYILNTSSPLTAVSCSCFTTNSARPSPSPSPSILSPGATPQPAAVPVSMSYLGMPYLFHSIPFLQPQSPVNGFVPQPGMASSGQGFGYTLPNGMTAISPELIYPGQSFALQSPSSQSNPPCPPPVMSPVSQCYGAFPQTAVPIKLVSCFNCGKVGHRGTDCKELTMDDVNKSGKFHLNYNPLPKMPDGHD